MNSDNCVLGDAVDEWLQARHAMSIEIFWQDPSIACLLLRLTGTVNCVIRGMVHSDVSVRLDRPR